MNQAFEKRINHIKFCKPNQFIVVGDENLDSDIVKVYSTKESSQQTEFEATKILKFFGSSKIKIPQAPVTAVDANNTLSCLALGLSNGIIILLYGDIQGKTKIRVLQGNQSRITGLHFRTIDDGNLLFCVTPNGVFKYTITKRGVSELEGLGDDGCDQIGCSTLNDEMNLVIARRDGIWYYGPEGLIAKNEFIRGRKVLIRWFKKNLVVVGIGKRILYYLACRYE